MKKIIINGVILTPTPLPPGYAILIEQDKIQEIAPEDQLPSDIKKIDAKGNWVIPGLIDVHIHGMAGKDTMDENLSALEDMSRFLASTGVTSFLPTTPAASNDDIKQAIDRIENFKQIDDGARVLGIHLEGPYLGFEHKGAQPEQHLRPAQKAEYLPWLESDVVKLITVAPEIDGVMELISIGNKAGKKFAVGHSSANYDQMMEAIDRGLSQATHTFNGMKPLHHREPGVLGAVLTDDRVFAQVITDGIHLHPAVVKLLFKVKSVNGTIIITDAIRAAGKEDGTYTLADQIIEVKDGIARAKSGSLAGSTLKMNAGLKNACKFTDCSINEILPSATSIVAESLDWSDQIGWIKPGHKADIVILTKNFTPMMTIVGGKIVYKK